MKLNKKQRHELFNKYSGRCAYCGWTLQKGWHADHLKPLKKQCTIDGKLVNIERDNFDNMMPSCPSCNIMKSDFSIEQFRENIKNYVSSLNKHNVQYTFAKKFGLIQETGKEVKFYFEKMKGNNSDNR